MAQLGVQQHSSTSVQVRCFHRGGSTVRQVDGDKWINDILHPVVSFNPHIVYLHVGENDLMHLEAPQLADLILSLMSYIRSVCQPRVLIVSQLVAMVSML